MPLNERRERILAVGAIALEETLDQLRIGQPPDRPQRMQRPDLPEGLTGRFPGHRCSSRSR